MEIQPWWPLLDLGDEFVGIDFGDQRLSHCVVRIADRLGKFCRSSIPAATDGRAEMEAVYRVMGNPKVSAEKLAGPHRQATLERRLRGSRVIAGDGDTVDKSERLAGQ
jgi:hypothetical protein